MDGINDRGRLNAVLTQLSAAKLVRNPVELEPSPDEPATLYDRARANMCYLKLHPSLGDTLTLARAREWVGHLHSLKEPVSFEILGLNQQITLQLVVQKGDRGMLQDSISSCYPNSYVEEGEDTLLPHYRKLKEENYPVEFHFLDYYLSPPFYLPLATFDKTADDPLDSIYLVVSSLKEEEVGFYQLLFIPCRRKWASVAEVILAKKEEEYKFRGNQAGLRLNKAGWEKIRASTSFYAIALHVGVICYKQRGAHLLKRLHSGLARFQNRSRKFHFHMRNDYRSHGIPKEDHRYLLLNRVSFHQGMVVNDLELAAFCHPPSAETLKRGYKIPMVKKTFPAPDDLIDADGVLLGENTHRGHQRTVYLPDSRRNRHVYIVGSTQTGKSTLIANLVRQDLEAGNGIAVVDPHGDLIADLLPLVPQRRVKDVVLLDAADASSSIALNMLEVKDENEVELVVSDLMVMFQRLFGDTWGPRMENILRNAVYTLVLSGGKAFPDIKRILIDQEFRGQIVRQIVDPEIRLFWEKEFITLPKSAFDPVINKLSKFLLSRTIRRMLSHPRSQINFLDLMQSGKVFLASLPQGRIGEDNAQLLGMILVSQIQLAAMRRAALPRSKRRSFHLYVDEFQSFTVSSFDKILSEAGKYKLTLTMAHQHTSQLPQGLRSAIFGNVGTLIAFRLGLEDARLLKPEIGQFTPDDILNLGVGEAIVRIGKARESFNLETPPPPSSDQDFTQQIIEQSRRTYGVATKPSGVKTEPVVTEREVSETAESKVVEPEPARVGKRPTKQRKRVEIDEEFDTF